MSTSDPWDVSCSDAVPCGGHPGLDPLLQGYLLLLLDCPVGLLGLAYVLLLVPALIVQPRRGRFVVVGSGGGEEGPGSPGTAVLEAVIRGSVQGTGEWGMRRRAGSWEGVLRTHLPEYRAPRPHPYSGNPPPVLRGLNVVS